MQFERLFKKTSIGQIQFWQIETQENKIITKFGKVDGKEQTTEDTILVGKNIGKANETSPTQQAQLEAAAQWEGKIKKGYVKAIDSASKGETLIEGGGCFPMLAKKFSEDGDKIVYPCYVQPKLDGHRCIADPDGSLWSRTRKPITSVPHIATEIHGSDWAGARLDGELYNHDYRNNFEKLSHFIRQETPEEGCGIVQYHVYDAIMPGTFKERYDWLAAGSPETASLHLVTTIEINNEAELMQAFELFMVQGYEGAIVRNANGLYVNKRSDNLQKMKNHLDEEFEIVGIEEGRGKLQDHVGAFTCKTKDGITFNVKMAGETEKLREYFKNPQNYIGKMLTVNFQDYTGKNKVPRFPVGLRIREKI